MKPGIVYLMYHELEVPGRPLCQAEAGYVRYIVVASEFRAQLQSIKDAGWQGIRVGQALAFPEQPSVAITFDDGCETDLLVAAPILREFGFGATFYITSGFLGSQGYLSAGQLKQLANLGFEVGCHSMTHPYLSDLNEAGLRKEIVASKAHLEQIVGRPVQHFSCPGGSFSKRALEIAREAGYLSVATSQTHANAESSDPFALGRVAVMRGLDLKTFESFYQGHGLWHLTLRDNLRSCAKRLFGYSFYDRVRATMLRNSGTH
jgi:peptidoglycan/xylan/chitin deacetylase (PgdA/CDA1 family)